MDNESENCDEPWKNYEDENFITNKELEISFVKTWFNKEKYVYPMYNPYGKIHISWL